MKTINLIGNPNVRARSTVCAMMSRLSTLAFRAAMLITGRRMPAFVSVAALIHQDAKLLLVNRSDGYGWGLPGGMVEGEESTEDALVREVLEETGLKVQLCGFFKVYSGKRGDPRWPSVCVVYCCTIVGGELCESPEGHPEWMPDRITPMSFAFDTERIISDYLGTIARDRQPWKCCAPRCGSFGAASSAPLLSVA